MTKGNFRFRKYFFILFLIISVGIVCCSKDKKTIIEKEWIVESIQTHSDSAVINAPNSYVLKFENSRNYAISLDVNSCFGSVSFGNKNSIDFGLPACTEICCDSDYADNLADVLVAVNKYEVTESSLVLTGPAGKRIKLKKK